MDARNMQMPPDLRLHPPARRYAGVWVGCITVCVVAATLFCEAHLTAAPIDQTIMTAAIMILSCFIMYTSLFDAGHQKAEGGELYVKAMEAYRAVHDSAYKRLGDLEAFCVRYTKQELEGARGRLLEHAGLTPDTWQRWRDHRMPRKEYRALSRQKRHALHRAARLKPIRLHATMLLSGGKNARRSPMLSTARSRTWRTMTALVPTFVGSLITVAVTLEGVALTAAAIIGGILRLFTVVWCGVRGYSAGVYAVTEDDCAVLECKCTFLAAFVAESTEAETQAYL